MDTIKPFHLFLNKFVTLTQEEFAQQIVPFIRVRQFAKREIITKTGEIEKYFNFVIKGLVRKYYKRGKEEINTQISFEGHIIHSQESFHSKTPSEYTVEAIEPSILVSISFDDLERIYDSSKRLEHLGRLVITHTMVHKDRYQMQLVMHTPRERFVQFVRKNPELLQRVPQKYLASYLHIKPETFSRFKHLLRNPADTVES